MTIVAFILACGQQKSEQQAQVQLSPEVASFVHVIDELTLTMQNATQSQLAIDELRSQIAKQSTAYRSALTALNDKILSLSDEQRQVLRRQSKDSIDEALRRFARAQKRLRSNMNEGQKVELSEVLMTLR